MFFQLAKSAEGMRTLQALATDGMKAWGCSEIAVNCLSDAFRDLRFRTQILSALENFADTARLRFALPDAAVKSGWPSPHPNLTVQPNPPDPPDAPPPFNPNPRRRRGLTP